MRTHNLVRLNLITVLAVAALGCQMSPSTTTATFVLAPNQATLLVRVEPSPYRIRYLPQADWDSVEGVLTGPALAGGERRVRAGVVADPASRTRSASLTFGSLPPGEGYKLVVRLTKADESGTESVVVSYTQEDVAVSQGPNVITLDGSQKAFDSIDLPIRTGLGPYVTSIPPGQVPGRIRDAQDIVVDASGTYYFIAHSATSGKDEIRRMARNAHGKLSVSTLAGQGTGYQDGDGLQAQFNKPRSIAVDANGVLYVADTGNHCIRKIVVDDQGSALVSTLAGNGTAGFADGSGNQALFNAPEFLAVDAGGAVWVADTKNHRIRKIATMEDGSIQVSTEAGVGAAGFEDGPGASARFQSPRGLAIRKDGSLVVADAGNFRLRLLSPGASGTTVTTVAGNGTMNSFGNGVGPAALVGQVTDMTAAPDGSLYLMDSNLIRKVSFDASGTAQIAAYAGSTNSSNSDGPGPSAFFRFASGLFADETGRLLVTEWDTVRMIQEDAMGTPYVSTIAGSYDYAPAEGANGLARVDRVLRPSGVATDADGNVFVADAKNHQILKLSRSDQYRTWQVVAGDGIPGYVNGPGASARFYSPRSLAFDEEGALFVVDMVNSRIRKVTFDTMGNVAVSTLAGSGLSLVQDGPALLAGFREPFDLAFDGFGRLFVSDRMGSCIRKIALDGDGNMVVTTVIGQPGVSSGFADGNAAVAKFSSPEGIAFDSQGHLLVADSRNHRIRSIRFENGTAVARTLAGGRTAGFSDGPGEQAQFNTPTDVAVDAEDDVFVSDASNSRIRKLSIDPFGYATVSTYAGSGLGNADGPARLARFEGVGQIALHRDGHLFVLEGGGTFSVRQIIP